MGISTKIKPWHGWIIAFILLSTTSKGQIALKDQLTQPKQIAIGINDTYYGFGTFSWKGWQATAQQSFFASKQRSQYWLLDAGYTLPFKQSYLVSAKMYSGGKFSSQPPAYLYTGLEASATYKRISLSMTAFIPLQADASMRYKINGQYEIWKEHISITGAWKPHPFLSNPQQYLCMGILFKEKHLQVMPSFQIPDNLNGKQMQLLLSFYYNFAKN